jgi:hypothetical protein
MVVLPFQNHKLDRDFGLPFFTLLVEVSKVRRMSMTPTSLFHPLSFGDRQRDTRNRFKIRSNNPILIQNPIRLGVGIESNYVPTRANTFTYMRGFRVSQEFVRHFLVLIGGYRTEIDPMLSMV